jgi:hypothetical protein
MVLGRALNNSKQQKIKCPLDTTHGIFLCKTTPTNHGSYMYYGSSQVPITAYIRILLLCISEKKKKSCMKLGPVII